jgi:hypothetical protein
MHTKSPAAHRLGRFAKSDKRLITIAHAVLGTGTTVQYVSAGYMGLHIGTKKCMMATV